jgi:ADP-ribose pyrophosphatase YjhB (NUDIX family)
MDNGVKHKVLAYITRRAGTQTQLLVFEHADQPEAGVQVPAGTVEAGEPVEQALWREIEEEAGLRPAQLRLVQKLAEYPEPERGQLRHVFHLQAAAALPETWTQAVAGAGDDAGLRFKYRWADLGVPLAGAQDQWLTVLKGDRS